MTTPRRAVTTRVRSGLRGLGLAGLVLLAAACASDRVGTSGAGMPRHGYAPPGPPHDPWGPYIVEAAARHDVPEVWIREVMLVESAGRPDAISQAGAMGLMQVMPATYEELRLRYGLGADPFHPRDNILAGTAYLREMWDRYGNVAAMLAAYNAGPGRYDEYRATARPLPAETRAYVAALTPILLGERPSGGSSSVVPPLDWREAAIFVAGEIGATASDPASPDPTPRDAPSFVPAAPETLTALQPEGLFVARSAGEDQP